MKLSCNIIQDLLPLYAEGMVSEDSRGVVEEHIRDCAPCRNILEGLRQETVVPVQTDTATLEHLQENIRRRRNGAAVLAILITATVLFTIFNYFFSPVYLSAGEAITNVKENGDTIVLELSPQVSYYRWQNDVDPDSGRKSMTFIAAGRRWSIMLKNLFGFEAEPDEIHLASDRDIWYVSTAEGEEDTLLWGQKPSGGRISLPRLVLGYYFMMAIAGGLFLVIPACILRKKMGGKILGVTGMLCICFALSDLITMGGNWRIYDGYDLPILLALMIIQTILMTLSIIAGIRVWRTNRE